jgi:hypothetical protein
MARFKSHYLIYDSLFKSIEKGFIKKIGWVKKNISPLRYDPQAVAVFVLAANR